MKCIYRTAFPASAARKEIMLNMPISNKQRLFVHSLKQIPVHWKVTCSEITLIYMTVVRRGVHPLLTTTVHVVFSRILIPCRSCPHPFEQPCPSCRGPRAHLPGQDRWIAVSRRHSLRSARPPSGPAVPHTRTRLCPVPRTSSPVPRGSTDSTGGVSTL